MAYNNPLEQEARDYVGLLLKSKPIPPSLVSCSGHIIPHHLAEPVITILNKDYGYNATYHPSETQRVYYDNERRLPILRVYWK